MTSPYEGQNEPASGLADSPLADALYAVVVAACSVVIIAAVWSLSHAVLQWPAALAIGWSACEAASVARESGLRVRIAEAIGYASAMALMWAAAYWWVRLLMHLA